MKLILVSLANRTF